MYAHSTQINPIFLTGTNKHAVLLVHGFTATPDCMRPLAHHLNMQGYTIQAPLLAGHGHTIKQLAQTRWEDWYATVFECFKQLRQSHEKVFVAGLSLGGLLTLKLTLDFPRDISAIALLATPIRLAKWIEWSVFAVTHSPAIYFYNTQKKKHGPDIRDPEAKRNFFNLDAMPLTCVQSIIDLQHHLRKRLPEIKTPALLMHAKMDSTAPYASMNEIASLLKSRLCETVTLENSYHILTLDFDKDLVIDHVTSFFSKIAKI
jgi:carboxylesterase